MCATCGCSGDQHHEHGDHHHHDHKTIIDVERDILHQNNLLAERNRGYFVCIPSCSDNKFRRKYFHHV